MNQFNTAQRNAYRRAQAAVKAQVYMMDLKQKKMAQNYNLPSMKFTTENMTKAVKLGTNVGMMDTAINNIAGVGKQNIQRYYNDSVQYSSNLQDRTKRLVQQGTITPAEATNLRNNVLYLSNEGFLLQNYSQADLVALSKTGIDVSSSWEQAMQSNTISGLLKNNQLFKDRIFASMNAYATVAGTVARAAELPMSKVQTYKEGKSGAEALNEFLNMYYGVEND